MIAVGAVVVTWPLARFIKRSPSELGLKPEDEETAGGGSAERLSPRLLEERSHRLSAGELVFRNRFLIVTLLAQACITIGNTTANLFLIPHLEERGFSAATGGWVALVLGVTGAVAIFTTGWYSDRVGRKRLMILTMVLQAVGLLVFAYVSSIWMLVLFVVCNGAFARSVTTLVSAAIADYYSEEHRGRVFSLLTAVFALSAFAGPQIAAVVRDHVGSYSPMLVAYAGLSILAIFLTAAASRAMAPAKATLPSDAIRGLLLVPCDRLVPQEERRACLSISASTTSSSR